MTADSTGERPNRHGLREWRSRCIDAREAQHLQELIRRGAAGECTREELTAELSRVLAPLHCWCQSRSRTVSNTSYRQLLSIAWRLQRMHS